MHCWWLPSSLVGLLLAAGFAGASEIDLVYSTKAIVNGGILLVSFVGPGAILTGVIGVLSQAMSPTIM